MAKKITLVSKFSEGQKVWFVEDNKIKSGTVTGFEAYSFKTFYEHPSRIEVHVGTSQDVVINEKDAFASERALRQSLNGN